MRLSHTKMKTYLFCPKAYWFRYIEQIPTRSRAALAFGRAIHATIRELHLSDAMSAEAANAIFARIWQEVLLTDEPIFTEGKLTPASYLGLADEILQTYVASQHAQPPPFLLEFRFQIEQQFEGQPHVVTGVIDRIDEEPEGLIIWDFKTGRTRPNPRELAADVQLTLYAWAAEQVLGREVVRCIYYHLRKGERLRTERTVMDHERLLTEVIPNVVRGIEAQAFAGVYDYRCRMCEYREICQPDKFPPNTNAKE